MGPPALSRRGEEAHTMPLLLGRMHRGQEDEHREAMQGRRGGLGIVPRRPEGIHDQGYQRAWAVK